MGVISFNPYHCGITDGNFLKSDRRTIMYVIIAPIQIKEGYKEQFIEEMIETPLAL